MSQPSPSIRHDRIAATLQGIVGRVLRIEPQEIDIEAPFLELGADSLALVEALRGLQEAFGVKLTIRQLFEQFPSIEALASFLDQTLPADPHPLDPPLPTALPFPGRGGEKPGQASPERGAGIKPGVSTPGIAPSPSPSPEGAQAWAPPPILPSVGASAVERVFGMQIQAFNQLVAQQLQMLGARGTDPAVAAPPVASAPSPPPEAPAARPVLPTFLGKAAGAPAADLSERQQKHLDALIERYCRKTAKSKELTQKYRPWLADSRATVGFRAASKEMLYPLARARARGSRIVDIDGNEYVDVTMGMGVHLFGHQPDWLQPTIEHQVREGFELGPRSANSGEVAALFCELTGMERAAFTNSGTEACMTAIRLARARTGRSRIAMFAGSYHGHSDGTLAQTREVDGELLSFPVAPGVPPKVAEDVLVLDYGSDRALEVIRRHQSELAAVIVEPIQSRRPDLQPREFLHELRRITAESGIALIFDEMITGFRLHLGGAQAWFGVRADLATYGKVVGGGLPIGVVAGSAEYMDGIDGGMWQYGDASRPERDTTFFGGTFCQHPLAMAAAKTVLTHLKEQGPGLQEGLNARTSRFAARLNDFFTADKVPIRTAHAHSIFRFSFSANADLLFYHLVEKGVYVWEWRNCFLSTAHTDDDLDFVTRAIEESVEELRRGGFLPDRPSGPGGGGGRPEPAAVPAGAGTWERRGIKPAIAPAAPAASMAPAPRGTDPDRGVRFGLYFFGNYAAEFRAGKYDLLIDTARFADRHGFNSIWFPERHFHPFGGLSPNPSVLAAALARETERIALRAGSVVLPLHHPVRVAEEWSLVDNLSGGRIGLSYASGWHPNDFALAPEAYGRHRDLMFERAETVRRLWQGEAVRLRDGAGKEVDLRIFPLPSRRDLPVWITIVNNPDTYRLAGEMGAGVLTNLMGQTPEGLGANLAVYREALAGAGHPPDRGHVALLLHTFLDPDAGQAIDTARRPFYSYLESSVGLIQNALASEGAPVDFKRLSREDFEYMLELAYQRYVKTSALIGSPESVAPIVERLRDAGVDEIACLVDFGVAPGEVRASFPWIAALKDRFRLRRRPRAAEAVEFPLTEAQRDLYAVTLLGEEASLAYLEPGVLELRGSLDLGLLRRALQEVMDRHEAVRSVVPLPGDSDPVQRALPEVRLEVPLLDVTGCPPGRQEEASIAWLTAESVRSFDLARGPLLRASVLRLEPRLHRLGIFVHHLVADGLSVVILIREALAIYEAERAGRRAVLPPPLQFREYSAWLESGGAEHPGDEEWWRERLSGTLPVFAPPTDRPRPPVRGFLGARRRRVLEPELHRALHQLGRRQGATFFISLLAVYTAALHRWTGQDDLVVGGPAARRPLEGGDRLVGHCVDLVPYRSRTGGIGGDVEPTFLEHLSTIRTLVLDAHEHGGVPLARLVRELGLPHDPSRAPLVNAAFNFDPGSEIAKAGGLELVERSAEITHAKMDISLHVVETGGDLLLQMDYRTDLFEPATLDRLLERLAILTQGATADPSSPLGDLPLLTPAERRQVLEEWNATSTDYPRDVSIPDLVAAVAARDPGAPAVVWTGPAGEERMTYGELVHRAGELARRLRALGVGPEVRVALEMERSPGLIVAMLAVLEAGGAYVPIDPSDPAERRDFLLADSGAAVRVGPEGLQGQQGQQGHEGGRPWRPCRPLSPLSPLSLAYVIYTSGSTGRPKGVAIPHRGIVRLVVSTDYLRLRPGDRVAHVSNTAFDAATLEVWGALLNGAALVVIPREVALAPRALAEEVRQRCVTLLHLTTTLFNEVVREAPEVLRQVPCVIFGGEAASPERVRDALAAAGPELRLLQGYGPTESTTLAAVHRVGPLPAGRLVPIGRPIANTRVWVLDRLLRPVPVGSPGELCIGGDGLARGYLGRPDLTAERFVPSPFETGARLYRTGDLARWRPDGAIEFLGRTDAQVKIRGFRIEPAEIETVLAGCPWVREGAVVVQETEEGRRLVAFVVVEEGAAPDIPSDIRGFLAGLLPAWMVPAEVAVFEALPSTPGGKVDRRALALLETAGASSQRPFEAPRTPVEEIVAGAWADVLRRERVGIHDDFFALGGHSLLAGRVLSRLRGLLGAEVSLRDFFREPTVAGLARLTERARQSSTGVAALPQIPRAPRDGRLRLSFAQERLWLVDQLQPGSAAYNSFLPAILSGPLDAAALERALAEIRRRHEVLRTRFVAAEGGPVQAIDPPGSWHLPRVDLALLPPEVREAELRRQLEAEARWSFDLARGPLFRAALVRLEETRHALFLDLHHSVCDGWSMEEVLTAELSALYRAFSAGRPSPLTELHLQYADFAQWQRQWLQGAALEEQLVWWREALAGEPPPLDLPTDRPRPPVLSGRAETRRIVLPPDLVGGLAALARSRGATLFMALLTGLQAVLHRWSGRERIGVGTPVANRSRVETEGLLGFFVNTLVLAPDLAGNPTAGELLERVRDLTLGAFDHQDLPFEKLVAALQTRRDPGRNPLFQVLFVLQNNRRSALDLPGLEVGLFPQAPATVQLDLSFSAVERENGLGLSVAWNAGLFDRATIGRLLADVRRVLEGMVEDPACPLCALPLAFGPPELASSRQTEASAAAAEEEQPREGLQQRRQQVASRRRQLSPERRALLEKWVGEAPAAAAPEEDQAPIWRRSP